MVISKIFKKIFDEEVHSAFLKFGRGEFRDKYLIECKKQTNKWAIKTGPEYANLLVKFCLEKANEKIDVKGIIVSTFKIEAPFIGKIKQFMGIKQSVVSGNVSKKDLIELMNKFPRAFFALSFKGDDFELKIKPKAPKNAKPSTSGEKGAKAEFCSLKTIDKSIIEKIIFDYPNAKEIFINHTIKVNDIVYPKDAASLTPEEVREKSKRKGVIIRKVMVDGKKETSEANFEA